MHSKVSTTTEMHATSEKF